MKKKKQLGKGYGDGEGAAGDEEARLHDGRPAPARHRRPWPHRQGSPLHHRQARIAECLVGDETSIMLFTARNEQAFVFFFLFSFSFWALLSCLWWVYSAWKLRSLCWLERLLFSNIECGCKMFDIGDAAIQCWILMKLGMCDEVGNVCGWNVTASFPSSFCLYFSQFLSFVWV